MSAGGEAADLDRAAGDLNVAHHLPEIPPGLDVHGVVPANADERERMSAYCAIPVIEGRSSSAMYRVPPRTIVDHMCEMIPPTGASSPLSINAPITPRGSAEGPPELKAAAASSSTRPPTALLIDPTTRNPVDPAKPATQKQTFSSRRAPNP